ncbi:MAG: hypothetical protein JXX14_12835 [Deltaproteobacteria bacterium]|nr:hypothetical protein [Deltaproteobacteria bacterium]
MPKFNQRRLFQSVISVGLFVALGLAVLSVRLYFDGQRHFAAAEQAQSSGDSWRQTVMHYEDAAKSWFPGNPYAHRAFWRLSILAKSAEMRGEHQRAVYIWEVIRRSAVAQRHVFLPFKSYQETAQERLARKGRGQPSRVFGDNPLATPSVVWSIFLWLGLAAWIVGTSVAIFSSTRRWQLVTGGVGFLGALLWIVAAVLA